MKILRPGDPTFASPPRLELRGPRSVAQANRRATLVFAALIALSLGAAIAMRRGLVPWIPHRDVGFVPIVLGPMLASVVFQLLFRTGQAAAGGAALHDEGAVFAKEGAFRLEVPWSEVDGYRDGATAYVQLEAAKAPLASHVAIPTPTEADRLAVLAFLDGRGLKRLG